MAYAWQKEDFLEGVKNAVFNFRKEYEDLFHSIDLSNPKNVKEFNHEFTQLKNSYALRFGKYFATHVESGKSVFESEGLSIGRYEESFFHFYNKYSKDYPEGPLRIKPVGTGSNPVTEQDENYDDAFLC